MEPDRPNDVPAKLRQRHGAIASVESAAPPRCDVSSCCVQFKEYRPYRTIEQFQKEIGKYVDQKEVARLERYVTLQLSIRRCWRREPCAWHRRDHRRAKEYHRPQRPFAAEEAGSHDRRLA